MRSIKSMQKQQKLLFTILLSFFWNSGAAHKIIYLICPPRSCSTAFLRHMEARKDFEIINEPSWYAYNLLFFSYEDLKPSIKPGFPVTYPEVRQSILEKAKTKNVFVKEISLSVEPFLMEDIALLKNPDVYFVFLLRDPHAALISFSKKRFKEVPLEKFGYRSMYLLFEKIKLEAANPPLIILAEELSNYPEQIISSFCAHCDIPFLPESLHWPDLGQSFVGQQEWGERKDQSLLYHWHDAAIHSTGFRPLTVYNVDEQGRPTFAEVAPENLPEVIKLYQYLRPFYYALLQETDYLCCRRQ